MLNRDLELVFYVGTRKIGLLAGKTQEDEPRILQYQSIHAPQGFESGFVTNLDRASFALEELVSKLYGEEDTREICAHVVLGNANIRTHSFSSSQYYQGIQRTISINDVRAVIDQTRSVATLPLSEYVLQVYPESFIVNDMDHITNPIGLEAVRLGVNLKVFTMDFQGFKNLSRAFESADIDVKGFWPKLLTSSEAVLTPEEKEDGVILIDIADDVTSFMLWKNGQLAGSRVLPLGGKSLTEQIGSTWQIQHHDAEKVKERYASLELDMAFQDELIPLVDRYGKGSYPIKRAEFHKAFLESARNWLAEIMLTARAFSEEEKLPFPHYVFTGGGTCLEGFLEFLQKHFEQDARIGFSRRLEAPNELLVDPSLTGALGMFRWLANQGQEFEKLLAPRSIFEKTFSSAKDWFNHYF